MKVAILGTRGIPNHYGGFEQCAEYLAAGLIKRGFEVIVYNSHTHPYQGKEWMGVKIIHCYDPEDKLGTAGQFIYDLNCILNTRKENVDVILILGYTSSSVWGRFFPKNVVVTTNMDGLEWKRTKFSKTVKTFLLYAERLATKFSDHLIADSIGIQDYLLETYNKKSTFIPYGADLFQDPDISALDEYSVTPYAYNLLIARLEPENSIETILDGIVLANSKKPFLVIGKHLTKHGEYLKNKFQDYPNIKFIGGIYNITKLNNLRYYSGIYFHGHTVGGTNPSLLEAMASSSLICANNNPFNQYILGPDALYFSKAKDIANVVDINKSDEKYKKMLINNSDKIKNTYNWNLIVDQYSNHLKSIVKQK